MTHGASTIHDIKDQDYPVQDLKEAQRMARRRAEKRAVYAQTEHELPPCSTVTKMAAWTIVDLEDRKGSRLGLGLCECALGKYGAGLPATVGDWLIQTPLPSDPVALPEHLRPSEGCSGCQPASGQGVMPSRDVRHPVDKALPAWQLGGRLDK
ncbi:hypothetical protein CDD83_9870 [Cordyceps sp. RAO-2017]|nr:hypothetical protein CDD83_9870 [Cordyceps sp. RAO-2017]